MVTLGTVVDSALVWPGSAKAATPLLQYKAAAIMKNAAATNVPIADAKLSEDSPLLTHIIRLIATPSADINGTLRYRKVL
jgi:hypothetical protein